MLSSTKMVLLGLILLFTNTLGEKDVPFISKFHQDGYKLNFEWAELIRFDKHYVNKAAVHVFKRTRNSTAVNMTIEYNIDIGYEMEIILQAYKFTSSNDYRLFPMRFEVNFCETVALNAMGVHSMMSCGNFTGCPLKGALYEVCNWLPDEKMFPPLIPNGRYKMELQGLYRSNEMWLGNVYAEVYQPFGKK